MLLQNTMRSSLNRQIEFEAVSANAIIRRTRYLDLPLHLHPTEIASIGSFARRKIISETRRADVKLRLVIGHCGLFDTARHELMKAENEANDAPPAYTPDVQCVEVQDAPHYTSDDDEDQHEIILGYDPSEDSDEGYCSAEESSPNVNGEDDKGFEMIRQWSASPQFALDSSHGKSEPLLVAKDHPPPLCVRKTYEWARLRPESREEVRVHTAELRPC